MDKKLPKVCDNPLRCSFIYLIGLNLLRFGIQIYLYHQGFISVAADEFARGIRAVEWSQTLNFNILTDVQGTWLPFEKYLNGMALWVWPDVILAPRATVFLASCLLIIIIFFLAHYLFGNYWAAIVSTIFISFQPWYVWLSGTPMLEMYYFAAFFAGLLLLLVWLKEARKRYWFFAGICFFLASGFHVQSWTLINLVNLLTLPTLYQVFRRKEYLNIMKLIAYYVLSNSLIISFGLIEYFNTGEVFAFLAKHTSYSKWYYNGYDISVLDKFRYYPNLLIQNSNLVIWSGLLISILFLFRAKEWKWKIFPLLVSILGLLLNSTMNIFSGPPSAAPGRYSLFHIIVLSLYVGYGMSSLAKFKLRSPSKLVAYFPIMAAVLILAYGIWLGGSRLHDYPKGMSTDSVAVGHVLNDLLANKPGSYMVELQYWDFLAVELTAGHFDKIVFDRVKDRLDRNTPSIFLQEDAYVCQSLMLPNLRYVVLLDEDLKLRAEQIPFLKQLQNVGRWTIYELFLDEFDCA